MSHFHKWSMLLCLLCGCQGNPRSATGQDTFPQSVDAGVTLDGSAADRVSPSDAWAADGHVADTMHIDLDGGAVSDLVDAGLADMGLADMGLADTGLVDVQLDAGLFDVKPDAGLVDVPDAGLVDIKPDAVLVDIQLEDTRLEDASLEDAQDSRLEDVRLQDVAPEDSAAEDIAVEDASGIDSVTTDAAGPDFWQRCFGEIHDPAEPGPDYQQFFPTFGNHCAGTNHQQIQNVERVVFIGDSITVGTPPTQSAQFYRSRLADLLVTRFGLEAPSAVWKTANPVTGQAGLQTSGDFASCAEWGARTDDLMRDKSQVEDCLPLDQRDKRTLVIITIGGNDIASLAQDGAHAPYEQSLAEVEAFVALMRQSVEWIKEPGRFPNGVYVLFANMLEYTDGTGDMSSCPAAELAGFTEEWDHPEWLRQLLVWANEQYMSIAVDTGSDMLLLFEHFCGHGFHRENPEAVCYRGPGAEMWFDLTCIHPNPAGHQQIADLFFALIEE